MKSKIKILILITLLNIFLFSSIFNSRFSNNIKNFPEFKKENQIQITPSGFWNLTVPIFIDDLDPNYNWSKTAIENDWCSGSGNWTDPYSIENVTIDGQGTGDCLEIRNSKVYFIIRNCSFYNSGSNPYDCGIKLNNVDNGKIINITCIDNFFGIYLESSYNNTLSENTANYNLEGIKLIDSNKTIISGNNASNNYFNGIQFSGNNNTLSLNVANNITHGHGIEFSGNNNTLLGNTASSNPDGDGIIFSGDNNTLSGNTANYNSWWGIVVQNSNYNTFSGNTANNNSRGIVLQICNYNTLSGNTACNNTNDGILFTGNNNTLSGNNVSNNIWYGLYLSSSNNNTLSRNIANGNNDDGIYLDSSNNNTLSGNIAIGNNDNGVYLDSCNNNILSGNNASNNKDSGIYLYNSDNNTLSKNTENCNLYGINIISSNDNTLTANNIANNPIGIYLYYCFNNNLTGNLMNSCGIWVHGSIVEMTSQHIDDTNLVNNKPIYYYTNEIGLGSSNFTNAGQIILINCSKSIISDIYLSNTTIGIYLGYSNNNNISGNIANNNYYGIWLNKCNNNTLSGNNISNNYACGIFLLDNNNNNTFSRNTIINNNNIGISLGYCNNNTLSRNEISNNNYGIYLSDCSNNTFSENNITNNNYGICFSDSNYNNIFLNHFILNAINAEDNGTNNRWDNGIIGNYWDDYTGIDANHDGIGDTPYNISGTAGSQDNFPIFLDVDDIVPIISIIFPLPDGVFGLSAPNYNISVDEPNLDTFWYTLDGGITNYTIKSLSGRLDQTGWDTLSEGSITIRFYANDTAGNVGSAAVTINKDISPPNITIITPLTDEIFGLIAPNYNISIEEVNLDTIWYSLDGGITNYTITGLTGTLNQTVWEALTEGSVTIRFYANDTAGNISNMSVKVIKDIPEDQPSISFGNYYILFIFITLLSLIILEKQKKK